MYYWHTFNINMLILVHTILTITLAMIIFMAEEVWAIMAYRAVCDGGDNDHYQILISFHGSNPTNSADKCIPEQFLPGFGQYFAAFCNIFWQFAVA